MARWRQLLSDSYVALAGVQRDLGRPAEAAAAALERKQLWRTDSQQLYDVASELARCIPLVGKGKTERTTQEEAQRRQYAEQAIAALGEALRHGYEDRARIKSDVNLAPLHTFPAFQDLLTEKR